MNCIRNTLYLVSAMLTFAAVSAEAVNGIGSDGKTLQLPEDQLTVNLRQTAMPKVGEGRLAKILTRFYTDGLGGPENWANISSLKVAGTLVVGDEEFEMNGYQKKPNLIKLTIRSDQRNLILCYDGKTAWRQLPGYKSKAEMMPEKDARKFVNSSTFGNHLLYPFALGKKIEYIDTVPAEGSICHQLRVTLDTDYQVDYYLDIRTYLEVKVVNIDLRDDTTSSVIYKDYVRVLGMPIAKKVDNYENGKWLSTLTLDETKVNTGIMPWMFKMDD